MTITEADRANARQAWGDGLIAIATAFDTDGIDAARPIAEQVIDVMRAG